MLLPLQPLLASARQSSSLPSCCRRNGAHHCMMLAFMASIDSGTQTIVTPPPCPFWKVAVVPAVVATVGASREPSTLLGMVGNVGIARPAFVFDRVTGSQRGRAPPAAIL